MIILIASGYLFTIYVLLMLAQRYQKENAATSRNTRVG